MNEYRSNADALDMITSVVVRSPLLREGLNKVLTDAGVSVHCENPTREVALIVGAMRDRGADLVILDGSLCEAPSELVVSLRQELPGSRIVIITAGDSVKRIPDESIAVADGFLSAETSKEEIILSLRLIKLGGRVVPRNLLSQLLGSKFSDQGDEPLPSSNRVPQPGGAAAISARGGDPAPFDGGLLEQDDRPATRYRRSDREGSYERGAAQDQSGQSHPGGDLGDE